MFRIMKLHAKTDILSDLLFVDISLVSRMDSINKWSDNLVISDMIDDYKSLNKLHLKAISVISVAMNLIQGSLFGCVFVK